MIQQTLSAGEICTRDVVCTDPGMRLDEAARLMRTHHVGALVVVEERPREGRIVVGMLTDRDIAMNVVAAGLDARTYYVGEVMSPDVTTAREGDAILDLLALMRQKRIRRLPVTGARGELIGLVALDDVLEAIARQHGALADAVGAAWRHEALELPPGTA